MRSIRDFYIYESKQNPSALKKLKTTEYKVKNTYRGGDIYDTVSGTYEQEDTYYKGDGNGYIMNKDGKVFDVIATQWNEDCGAIAGGTLRMTVAIKRVLFDGKEDITLSGYHGLFSSPSSKSFATLISDLEDGSYLEDYLAKHIKDVVTHNEQILEEIKNIAANGDVNASTSAKEKQYKKEEKIIKFNLRYLKLPKLINFKITDEGVKLNTTIDGTLENVSDNRKIRSLNANIRVNDIPEDEVKEIKKKFYDACQKAGEIVKPYVERKLIETFKVSTIYDLIGISGYINCDLGFYNKVAIDTKENKFVVVDVEKNKVINENPKFEIGDVIYVYKKDKLSDTVVQLFTDASEAYIKLNKRTKTKYIDDNWQSIYNEENRGWYSKSITKTEAKKKAEHAFNSMIAAHDWNKVEGKISFPFDFIKDSIKGNVTEIEDDEIKNNEKSTSIEKTSAYIKAKQEAVDKMTKWHNGERGFNIKSASASKLKLNYKVCKELGFDEEANKIKAVADQKGVVLESVYSIQDYVDILCS